MIRWGTCPILQQSLCVLGKCEGDVPIKKAINDDIKEWFHRHTDIASKHIAGRFCSITDLVQYAYRKEDLGGVSMRFVLNFLEAFDGDTALKVTGGSYKCKTVVKMHVITLAPL